MSNSLQTMTNLWQRLQSREQWAVGAALGFVFSASIWVWLVKPALHTLSTAAAQHAVADAQLAAMQQMAAAAQAARSVPQVSTDESVRVLESLVKAQLGAGSGLSVAGDQASVTLKGVPAQSLLSFVQSARVQARALPAQVSLQRSAPAGTTTAVLWDGRLTLSIYTTP